MTTGEKQSARAPAAIAWIALGLTAGAVIALLAPGLARSEPIQPAGGVTAAPPVGAGAKEPGAPGRSDANAQRAIDRRLAALEERATQSAVPPEPSAGADSPTEGPEPPLSPEAIREQIEGMVARQTEAHEREGIDPAWAGKVNGLVSADLDQMAGAGHFRAVHVDCRTTSCMAVLEWERFDQARESMEAIARFPYQANCARALSTPEPDDPAAPYQARLFLRCEGWRAEGN
jgi:hypothetical protein